MGLNNSYNFNIEIYDSPRFSNKKQLAYEVSIGSELTINLPVVEEYLPITVSNANMPAFAIFKPPF
jgi:hypothetical protein